MSTYTVNAYRINAYTVTIAGRERFDGEAPFAWVVDAIDIFDAIGNALRIHCTSQEETVEDVKLIGTQSFEGIPAADCGYHWNDERSSV
ncbi:hypothetical protein [Acrocarpospora sp. B8E8]|uniref:hypothetical protein n=1 Tax=Acrocarpospora sp. B8E8 TaxID=3153572 RepID=UPI00325D6D7A